MIRSNTARTTSAMTATTPVVGTAAAKGAAPPPLTPREKLYASGNRKRQNLAKTVSDPRPRSRLYAKA